jgi:SpoVK/Ycf46/Vps4 family AAA+-type ATPase
MNQNEKDQPTRSSGVEGLVQPVATNATWADLTLGASQRETLQAIAREARRSTSATDKRPREGGSPVPSSRVTALFVAPDRTGATQAAGVLARDLGRDLYRVDLGRVVSKYIGETEKNLDRLFDAAESAGWVLLFDEADALFGKRTDVKDSHDRYANLDTNYLLERIEAFHGVAILATNRKASLDDAFIRRLRYVVELPRPPIGA